MKQIVIISGKGGTGKTSFTAALSSLYENITVADCDVDAPDLHILLKPEIKETEVFMGGKLALLDNEKCTNCGRCFDVCNFKAVKKEGNNYSIDALACEGCSVCSWNCPAGAITMIQKEAGESYVSKIKNGMMVHALLEPGEENSGKLVSKVKKQALLTAEKNGFPLLLVDGSPGIGCPVIASLSGADIALVVTEPTKSGIHDMDRVVQTARHFKVPVKAVINKSDLNLENTQSIVDYLKENNIELLGKIPFSKVFQDALTRALTVTQYSPDSEESKSIINIKNKITL